MIVSNFVRTHNMSNSLFSNNTSYINSITIVQYQIAQNHSAHDKNHLSH